MEVLETTTAVAFVLSLVLVVALEACTIVSSSLRLRLHAIWVLHTTVRVALTKVIAVISHTVRLAAIATLVMLLLRIVLMRLLVLIGVIVV